MTSRCPGCGRCKKCGQPAPVSPYPWFGPRTNPYPGTPWQPYTQPYWTGDPPPHQRPYIGDAPPFGQGSITVSGSWPPKPGTYT